MSQTPSDAVYEALFQLGASIRSDQATPFKTWSRRFRHWSTMDPHEWPAFFQFQSGPRKSTGGNRGLPVRHWTAKWIIYLPASQGPNDAVSPVINRYYDALSNLLFTNPAGEKQTLGGLVDNCFEEGEGLTDEGLLDTPSLIVIPITIITGI